ncbi:acetylxylan esterase [Pelagicoccus mobilis]|uniref:Acetylxylan esterase n=1 Tax=Pelagicoccus mobilis TaxID=415221 RepID=A0A934VPS1_9BACT|nr:acetylxylan esterase [Pelagicoccus mobilis]MBK1876110.1 acetylxylan esterase [Pelagicoccus mobilis]
MPSSILEDIPFAPNCVLPANTESELPRLLQVSHAREPEDFESFWKETYQQALQVDPKPALSPSNHKLEGFDTFNLTYTSYQGASIKGWLAIPTAHPIRRGLVITHGYGGRERPDTIPLLPDAAMIFPCLRELPISVPEMSLEPCHHVLRGIESRGTYIHRGCVADVWVAVTALVQLAPQSEGRIDYVGTSFGGGIGALALPWDDRLQSGVLGVPSFGNNPVRLAIPCGGSGAFVQKYVHDHPEALEVLAYYDSSVSATYTKKPVLVECALKDEVVPPESQFSVFNSLKGPRQLFLRQRSHCEYPDLERENKSLLGAIREFFA